MEETIQPIKGHIQVWGIRKGVRTLDYEHKNTIFVTLYTNLRTVMISRSVEYGVDAIAWGSFKAPSGTFIDSSWAGTTSSGTQGALIQSAVGSIQAKFSGTFSFAGQKQLNYFELGRGYTPAAAGVTQLFTSRYAYDQSLLTGSTALTYESGDSFIINWTFTVGS